MSAYVVGLVEVSNWDAYREYMRHTPRLIEPNGQRVVVIEFPSLDQAKAFYHSSEYAKVRRLREGAGDLRLLAIEGFPDSAWQEAVRESRRWTLE